MPVITTLAGATALEAVRNRLLWLAAIIVAIALGIAQFLSQVAIIESREIQSALLAAMLRAAAVFIASTFVITSMVRELNDKVTELMLSLPAPRAAYFFGKLAGYALVAAVIAVLFALPLALFARPEGVAVWAASLLCELLIMTAVSLFCVLALAQVPSAFAAVAGFYLLSRSMAAMQTIAGASLTDASLLDRAVNRIVDLIALLLPGLDRMTDTAWLLVSAPAAGVLGTILAQTAIYLALISAAALFDLYRKNF